MQIYVFNLMNPLYFLDRQILNYFVDIVVEACVEKLTLKDVKWA